MIEKKDYTGLYQKADLMYADEILTLMNEMKINTFQISDDGMDVDSLLMDDDTVYPKMVMRDGRVMDIDDIRGIGERLYNIVYAEYQSRYKETVADKIKRMDFDTLIQFLSKKRIIPDASTIFRMNDKNSWRSLMDEYSAIHIIKRVNDAYLYGIFNYHDEYVVIDKDNKEIDLKTFNSVLEIVEYFEYEINKKCSDEDIS